MPTNELRKKILETTADYATKEAVVPEALRLVQLERGWVSDEDVEWVGEVLGLHPADIEAVADFYPLIFRKPVGRHVIVLCDSVSCWIMGYPAVKTYLRERLGIGFGETTSDGRFTLLPGACLGACDKAPAMLVDGELHTGLTPESVDGILNAYV